MTSFHVQAHHDHKGTLRQQQRPASASQRRAITSKAMTDLTLTFNASLGELNAPPTRQSPVSLQNIDEFLKEAYRIVCSDVLFSSA